MTEQTDRKPVELPRFVRPIGLLDRGGYRREPGGFVGVLTPFEGVLSTGVGRSDQLPPSLTYLTLTELVARGLPDRERRRRTPDDGPSISTTPDSPASSTAGRPSPSADDEPDMKVYHLLRGDADGQSGRTEGDLGPDRTSDSDDLGRHDWPDRTPREGRSYPDYSGGPNQPGGGDDPPTPDRDSGPGIDGASDGEPRSGPPGEGFRGLDPGSGAIRDLRRLDATRPGPAQAVTPGRDRSGSRGTFGVLDRPRTVLATASIPTRGVGAGPPGARSGSTVGSDAPPIAREGFDESRRGPSDESDRRPVEDSLRRTVEAPPDRTIDGPARQPPDGVTRGTRDEPIRGAPKGSPTPVERSGLAGAGRGIPAAMDVAMARGIVAGSDAIRTGSASSRALPGSGPVPRGIAAVEDRNGGGSGVPLTVIRGADSGGSGGDRGGDGGPAGATDEHGRRSSGSAASPRGGDYPGVGGSRDGAASGVPSTGDRAAGGWEFLRDLSLEGGGPDTRFIEELYRELTKKMRIENDRGGF